MDNALLSDVEARAERRRTSTRADRWQALVQAAWRRSQDASDPADARRWLERAHRMLPKDGLVGITLAATRMGQGEVASARTLFQSMAEAYDLPEAWAGLAASAHLLHDAGAARAALVRLLACSVVTPTIRALAAAVAGVQPWCGMLAGGVLHTSAAPRALRLDGADCPPAAGLPAHWRRAAVLEADGALGPMLGSPLPLRAFAGVEGFVEAAGRGITGWAWQPADPDQVPHIQVTGPHGAMRLALMEPADGLDLGRPLARPRRLLVSAADVQRLGEPLHVRGPDGRHLLGSPIEPGLEMRGAAGEGRFTPVWADVMGNAPAAQARRPPVDVVVPVYRGAAETLACLHSVLASVPRGTRVIVVDDASPDRALTAALAGLARQRRIRLLRLPENRGFPGAANAGLQAAAGRDAVLLNSDTLVPPGWLERLRAAAYAAPDIGSATPLTNDGTIVSYPDRHGGNPVPDLAATVALDAVAQAANAHQVADLPVGVGFCLYMRRDGLDQVGLLREDLFAQGYGEENDWCLRARHHGWRHVAALDVFVGHAGATSFGTARAQLVRRNGAILARLHPGYDALVAAHEAADPLHAARARMDALRWAAARRRTGAVVLVSHAGGGGVARVVGERAAKIEGQGQRAIVLRPHAGGLVVTGPGGDAYPNLVFPMPDGLPALARLLRADRVRRVEVHHLLGHHHAVSRVAGLLKAEAVSIVHDYARFCPRIALLGPDRRYCGEPGIAGCEACIADQGSLLEDDPPVPVLRDRSGAELLAAARVVAPSHDAASRITRHFPGVAPLVEPWEDDAALPPLAPRALAGGRVRIVAVGAIGREKGYDVLLACVRDAKARALPLDFVVAGFTMDDERLMAAGPAFVTGEYAEKDAVPLIQAQAAQAAFIPSIWPETWCFALTRAWQAGLPAFVFDLGAQAERMRRAGRGWTLPLGLSPRAVNDSLLRLAPGVPPSQSPPQRT